MTVSARSSAAPSASPGPEAPRPGPRARDARDIGLDQADADDAGLGNTTPPEPTKHAMPRRRGGAHGRGRRAAAGDGRRGRHGARADEVEGDLVPVGRGDIDPAVAEERAARPRKRRGRVITFLGHCVDELRRVQWPDRRQVGQGTAVVLGFVVLAGGYLGLLDALWKPLIEAIL